MDKRSNIQSFFYTRIAEHAKNNPYKEAVMDADGTSANYRSVLYAYDSLGSFLREKGIQPYERIAFATENGVHMAMMQLPLMENAVLAPIDISLPLNRVSFFMKLLYIDYIITDNIESPVCKEAEELGLGIIQFKCSMDSGNWNYSFTIEHMADYLPRGIEYKKPEQIMISTTSGTTDIPKVVPLNYTALIALTKRNCELYEITKEDIILDMNKTNRNLAVNNIMYALHQGALIILTNGFRHSTFVSIINRYRITSFDAAPAVFESLSSYLKASKEKINTDRLRFVRVVGAALTPVLKQRIEKMLGTTVVENFGMTETKSITSTYKAPYGYKEGSAGIPVGTDIKVLNGELLVRGETVFSGYENPEINNSDYFTDGWFHTGDEGYIDEDGYIFITGRIKEMINRGGEKISPFEVEKEMLEIKGITEAVVFPYLNKSGSEEAAAAVVVEEGMKIDIIKLRKILHGKISAYKLPSRLFVIPNIPVGQNNKIQRKTLNEKLCTEFPDSMSDLSGEYINKNEKRKTSKKSTVFSSKYFRKKHHKQ